jgi:hypothetical protein
MPAAAVEDLGKVVFGTDEFKGHVDGVVKVIAPLLVGAGLGAFVPIIPPLIIAGLANHLLPKALKVAGQKIEIAQEQLQQYQEQGGSKAILAKVFSPSLRVLKKVIPAPEKELHEALSESSTKLKEFFSAILDNPERRKEFVDNFQKYLTGDYGNFEEFQRNVKETMGISVDRLAMEAYSQYASIIYNRDILNKIITLEEISENHREEIRKRFEKLHDQFDKHLKDTLSEIEKNIISELTDQQLLSSGLYLVTAQTKHPKGEPDCWVRGYFRDADVKSGYDARRPTTDRIIDSLANNVGTILYGRPHYGKTMLLKRIMFEQIERGGYAVIFCSEVEANANRLIRLLQQVSASFSKLLIIVDDAHKKGSEEIFVAFNNLPPLEDQEADHDSHYYSSHYIRFLFAAAEPELNNMIENLTGRDRANEVKDAVRKLEKNKIILDFDINDAILFVEKAAAVIRPREVNNISKEDVVRLAEYWYHGVSKSDPFIFVFILRRTIASTIVRDGVTSEGIIDSFIESEMDEKINLLTEHEHKRAAIICSFMGALTSLFSTTVMRFEPFYADQMMLAT